MPTKAGMLRKAFRTASVWTSESSGPLTTERTSASAGIPAIARMTATDWTLATTVNPAKAVVQGKAKMPHQQ